MSEESLEKLEINDSGQEIQEEEQQQPEISQEEVQGRETQEENGSSMEQVEESLGNQATEDQSHESVPTHDEEEGDSEEKLEIENNNESQEEQYQGYNEEQPNGEMEDTDQSHEQQYDENSELNPEQHHDQYYEHNPDQQYDPEHQHQYDQQNYDQEYDQQYDQNYDQSYDQQNYDQQYDQNYDHNYDQSYDQEYDQSYENGNYEDHYMPQTTSSDDLQMINTAPRSKSVFDRPVLKKGNLIRKCEKKDGQKNTKNRNWISFNVELRNNVLVFYELDKKPGDDSDEEKKKESDKMDKKEREKREKEAKEAAKKREKEEKEREKEREKREKEEKKEREKREKEEKKLKEKDKKSNDKDKKDKKEEEKEKEKEKEKEREKEKEKEKDDQKEQEHTSEDIHSKASHEPRPSELISIHGATAEMALDYKKGKFIFKLTTEKKSEYYFECPDEKEAKLWIDAITAFSQFTEEVDLGNHTAAPESPKKSLFRKPKQTKKKKIFGADLTDQPFSETLNVPLFVEKCITHVEKNGLEAEGVYRLSGNAGQISELRDKIDHDITKVNFDSKNSHGGDLNVITGLLKLYFRELPEPLLTFQYYDSFIAAATKDDYNQKMLSIQYLVKLLPKPNFDTLKYLSQHLSRVSEHQEVNKMAIPNLAIVFGPNLLRPKDETASSLIGEMNQKCAVIEAILQQPVWMFE